MKPYAKKIGYLVAGLAIGVLLLFALQKYAERRISSFLENDLPPSLRLSYDSSRVNIFRADLEFSGLSMEFKDSATDSLLANLVIKELHLEGLDYWLLLSRDSVVWQEVLIAQPKVTYYARESEGEESEGRTSPRKFPAVAIRDLQVRDGSFETMNESDTSQVLRASAIRLDGRNFRVDSITLGQPVPFAYNTLSASLREFSMTLGDYEMLEADSLEWEDDNLLAFEFSLYTRLSPQELSREIAVERDHTTLHIPKIIAYRPTFGNRDTLPSFGLDSLLLHAPDLEIYRDKLIADDPKHKRMYGQMIRELPFLLTIPKLRIPNGHIGYEERITAGVPAGRITFDSLHAEITHLSNTYSPPEKTAIRASANFMDSAPMELDWRFDVNDTLEEFLVSGTISNFEAGQVNSFLEANMRARVSGYVDRVYFTIGGNAVASQGDMRMKYENFDFVILKEDLSGINKVLTFLGKIFVGDKENSREEGFRYGAIEAERDPAKSFFNYLWLNVRSGLKNTITGKGEKE